MKRKREKVVLQPGEMIQVFAKHEVNKLVDCWLETFGKNKAGVNTNAYLWHIFSFERYPSFAGIQAQTEYEKQSAPEYLILSNKRDLAFLTDQRPTFCSLRDYLVFPANLAWTMAFTHEDGWLGPYFAKHPLFESLNGENLAKLEKMRQIENAKQKGWF
jgi:Domain of unknown function (DUF4275)